MMKIHLYGLLIISLWIAISSQSVFIDRSLTLPPTPKLPNPERSGYVKLQSVKIWYAQYGPSIKESVKKGKAPVLFIHGGLGNSNYFGHQISYLLDTKPKTTILAIDSRMQGRSTGLDQNITYTLMREDVLGVLDHFEIPKAQIIGWSDGGTIGLDLVMNNPSRVDRLFAYGATYSYLNTQSTIGESLFNAYIERTQKEYAKLAPNPDFNTLLDKLGFMYGILPNYTREDFQKIPTLNGNCKKAPLIWIVDGDNEEVIQFGVPREMHEWINGSGLVILPSTSHFSFLQDPKTFNAVMERFLDYKVKCSNERVSSSVSQREQVEGSTKKELLSHFRARLILNENIE